MSDRETGHGPAPELSLVMPCYDEEATVGTTIPDLVRTLDAAGVRWQIVACDNGSRDRTGEILDSLARRHEAIVTLKVDVNQGYGHGILASLGACRGEWVGVVPCDGQVPPDDIVRLLELARRAGRGALVKVRRRRRPESRTRRIVSFLYNALMALLWPGLAAGDLNGIPKLVNWRDLEAMRLVSRDWMLDPEVMIKARYLRLRVIELEIVPPPRSGGRSKVRMRDPFVFLVRIASLRLGGAIPAWRRSLRANSSLASR